jgi:hypothetical protein
MRLAFIDEFQHNVFPAIQVSPKIQWLKIKTQDRQSLYSAHSSTKYHNPKVDPFNFKSKPARTPLPAFLFLFLFTYQRAGHLID